MTDTININLGNYSPEDKERLLKLIEKGHGKPKWEGPKGDWYIGGDGDTWLVGSTSGTYQKTGHCAKTKKQAEYIRDQLTHYAWMIHAWLEVVGDWRPDWKDGGQAKCACFNAEGEPRTDYTISWQSAHGFYFPTETQAKQWQEMVGERIVELGK